MQLDDQYDRVSHSGSTDQSCPRPAESGPSLFTGSVTIDGHQAHVRLVVDVEEHEWHDTGGRCVVRPPTYSWNGTLQLTNPEDAGALLVGWGDGRRTLTLADGRTAEVVQRSVDSFGQVEIVGLGPAPWWRADG